METVPGGAGNLNKIFLALISGGKVVLIFANTYISMSFVERWTILVLNGIETPDAIKYVRS